MLLRNDVAHVVIVGAGFAGISVARTLIATNVRITLIDRNNYHLFQPLLYQVATAGLSPGDISWPIRRMFRRQQNLSVIMGEVSGIDLKEKTVLIAQQRLEFDYLVLATGVRHTYFGNDAWANYAPGLKTIEDATHMRRQILLAFEQAESELDPANRQAYLNFVIVGGGPTGVELAGALAELAHKTLASDFRNIDPREARIYLVETGVRLLPSFDKKLSDAAVVSLEKLGVDVLLGQSIEACDQSGVMVSGKRLETRTILWAAGVAAGSFLAELESPADAQGRIMVNADFSLPVDDSCFVIGDAASYRVSGNSMLPGIAPAAKQAGRFVGRLLAGKITGREFRQTFKYRDYGNLATIGRKSAVIDFGCLQLKGWIAWWIWGIAHIYFLGGVRNRVLVIFQWFWSYLTFDKGARLITGQNDPE